MIAEDQAFVRQYCRLHDVSAQLHTFAVLPSKLIETLAHQPPCAQDTAIAEDQQFVRQHFELRMLPWLLRIKLNQ